MKYTEKKNGEIEKKIIYEQLDQKIKADIKSFGETVCEIERKYCIDTKDDYGTIGERYLLILLSDGNELRYNIINLRIYNIILALEIDTHYQN